MRQPARAICPYDPTHVLVPEARRTAPRVRQSVIATPIGRPLRPSSAAAEWPSGGVPGGASTMRWIGAKGPLAAISSLAYLNGSGYMGAGVGSVDGLYSATHLPHALSCRCVVRDNPVSRQRFT